MRRSRKQAWLPDELILALDLYRREGRNPPAARLDELSHTLRAIPIELELAADPKFRNAAGVYLKIANFVSIDPDSEIIGMTRGGRGDREVFAAYWNDPERLAKTADAIRANLASVTPRDAAEHEPEVRDALEGALLTRVHRVRERNHTIVKRKKQRVLDEVGRLACEACDFDFKARYGVRGEGFIECHHTVPLRDLDGKRRTREDELVLVCSNCHRMIHRGQDWLSVQELRGVIS